MVASKKIHCAACNKKCSGNVLRYQNQYYHKQCFELEQEQSGEQQQQQQQQSSTTTRALEGSSPVRPSSGFEQDSHEARGSYVRQQRGRDEVDAGGGELAATAAQQHSASQRGIETVESSTSNHLRHSSSTKRLFGDQSSNSIVDQASSGQVMRQQQQQQQQQQRSQTIDNRQPRAAQSQQSRSSATLPHSISTPNGFSSSSRLSTATCAGCREPIKDGQALIALELHWHVWCFKCHQCKTPLHGEYVAKDGKAYCEKDYQRLFGVTCVYCKRFITGKVLQAGETHHFHPSCARCSKCGDPFVPGEEMYLQGEVTWHPRCGPNPAADQASQLELSGLGAGSQMRSSRPHSPSLSSRSRSRSASPFSFMSRQYGTGGGRASPYYADSEAVGDLSRVYTISYLNSDPNQGYLRRPIEPSAPKSPQFSRPTSAARSRSSSSRSHHNQQYASSSVVGGARGGGDRCRAGGMYSVLSSMRSGSGSVRARSPSMMNEEAIQLAQYPSGQKPSADAVPKIERDDFPAPPFPAASSSSSIGQRHRRAVSESVKGERRQESAEQEQRRQQQRQVRASRPRSREVNVGDLINSSDGDDDDNDQEAGKASKEEEELSKIASGIGKIFLQTLKEREKVRAWKRANLDPRNASRTPSAQRELPSRPLRYGNPLNASPSRDMDRPRVWDDQEESEQQQFLGAGEQSPTRTRSSLGLQQQPAGARGAASNASATSAYGYKVVQSNRYPAPRPGYGLGGSGAASSYALSSSAAPDNSAFNHHRQQQTGNRATLGTTSRTSTNNYHTLQSASSSHLHRSMPNVSQLVHLEGPPKLYPYHLLATSNYRLPPDVDRCHLERHLANEEFQYIFHCDRLDFYRLPEWKRNELKRRAKLF